MADVKRLAAAASTLSVAVVLSALIASGMSARLS
jgi:hypothetical protein